MKTVNSQMMNLILNGKLPENSDLLDLGRKLKEGKKIKEITEEETLAIDIIVVVISAEDFNIPHTLLEEIYAEANVKTRSKVLISVSFTPGNQNVSKKSSQNKLFLTKLTI